MDQIVGMNKLQSNQDLTQELPGLRAVTLELALLDGIPKGLTGAKFHLDESVIANQKRLRTKSAAYRCRVLPRGVISHNVLMT